MKRNVVVLLVLVFVITLSMCSIPYLSRAIHKDDWKTRTTPLPKQTKALLCERFELLPKNALCQDNKNVYSRDFFPVIQNTFQSSIVPNTETNKATASFDDVEKKLGNFRYECEPIVHQAGGFSYFVCYYDFLGDREFIVAIIYSAPEKKVLRITGTSIYDE